jgi:polyphosphate glucokinase
MTKPTQSSSRVLVIDIGGNNVKMRLGRREEIRKFESGRKLDARRMVEKVRTMTADWLYDAVSIGYPGLVLLGKPVAEPYYLADGWVGFDYSAAFERPVKLINDAAMQAIGSYDGGRMLFLGLGTGLGSTLVANHVIVPLELGSLRLRGKRDLFQRLGRDGLERRGRKAWAAAVLDTAQHLRDAFLADYVVLGGGNAERIDELPKHIRRGGNEDAFTGGFRLWEEDVEPHDRPHSPIWRVVS